MRVRFGGGGNVVGVGRAMKGEGLLVCAQSNIVVASRESECIQACR